jgi:hypothetical protein
VFAPRRGIIPRDMISERTRRRIDRPLDVAEPSGEFAFESREAVALTGLGGEHVLRAVGWR